MLIAGGGVNSTIAGLSNPFDAVGEFKGAIPPRVKRSFECV
jgi:hypothetical protein